MSSGFLCDLNALGNLSYRASADWFERREIIVPCPAVEHKDSAGTVVSNGLCHIRVTQKACDVINDVTAGTDCRLCSLRLKCIY